MSAVTGDSAGHYFDVASWQIYGSIGSGYYPDVVRWLTDDTPRENRATNLQHLIMVMLSLLIGAIQMLAIHKQI